MKRPALILLLLPLLSGCQDREARAQNADLTRRVEALERQLNAVQTVQQKDPLTDAGRVTTQAAAQNCANSLTRELETFRQNSIDRAYPTPAQLDLPDACVDQRVNWLRQDTAQYTFTVTDRQGRELARQTSQGGS
ncbi:hypothetical protein GCM10008959_25090 [Deinococcus seoulensis]|uniref:Lipoprotein n=2 Tax=Deinococcus TaxID=1298 RepID=A0ABQ2RS69_9DEIO|nr:MULTISPECIES: hypothetical protein [Deinococcus]GGR62019.1 hypothetical protein GCM10008959_25090 [Deinococcus seoulensis]GGS34830.1 hypothetical protein GCM10008961_28150 [Deinococcus knuensis]